MLGEDLRVVRAVTPVQSLDQVVDPRRHDEEIAGWFVHSVPVGVRRSARYEQRLAGSNLALGVSDTEPEPPFEHDPRLVV